MKMQFLRYTGLSRIADYEQRRVIHDRIGSLLTGPGRSGLVVPAASTIMLKKRPNLRA
jgi:hypothetical protein